MPKIETFVSAVVNWRAIQASGAFGQKHKHLPLAGAPIGIKARYMSMGSWHGNLKKKGAKR